MSFNFQWPRFSERFHSDAIEMLNSALNKGKKPPVIVDRIEVVELEMGTQPPELEIRDIGDLTTSQFRGIFRLTYNGDAHIVLKTKVQANPLYHKTTDIHLMGGSKGMLAANQPLVVPMHLRLSNFKLNSYVVLVISKQKGITLVFKTDPLQNVDISSTFDSISVIQKFIQTEIEGLLRQMFKEDLPSIIHRLSQQWVGKPTQSPLSGGDLSINHAAPDTLSVPDLSRPIFFPDSSVGGFSRYPHSLGHAFVRPKASAKSVASLPNFTRREQEDDSDPRESDPTGGARPEVTGFGGLRRLHQPSKGLADLAEEEGSIDDLDGLDWDPSVDGTNPTVYDDDGDTAYETVPAVGGGSITRPRVYHSPSLLHEASGSTAPTHQLQPPLEGLRQRKIGHLKVPQPSLAASSSKSAPGSTYFHQWLSHSRASTLAPGDSLSQCGDDHHTRLRKRSQSPHLSHSDSSETLSTPPSFSAPHTSNHSSGSVYNGPNLRRASVSSLHSNPTFTISSDLDDPDEKIVLRPSDNNAISHLSILNYSNHTLSPYTRSLEHFTVRSMPPKAPNLMKIPSAADRLPVKAKRKRTYRLGGNKQPNLRTENSPAPSLPPEFDADDVERYFRADDG